MGSEWREGSVCQPIFRTNILLASNSNSLLQETFMFPEIWSTQKRREQELEGDVYVPEEQGTKG